MKIKTSFLLVSLALLACSSGQQVGIEPVVPESEGPQCGGTLCYDMVETEFEGAAPRSLEEIEPSEYPTNEAKSFGRLPPAEKPDVRLDFSGS